RTATEKAYPTVTAKILADLNAQLAQYDSYWSGVRSLQTATITLGGVGTYLSTQAEGGQYLALNLTADQYNAALKAAVDGHHLVRLAYNDSLNGNVRKEILGYLGLVAGSGANNIYQFTFTVYDPLNPTSNAGPVSLASLGYTAGSQGVLYGPSYALAGATDQSNANLPISFTLPSGALTVQQGSSTLRLQLSNDQLNAFASLSGQTQGDLYQRALAGLRTYTYILVDGQQLTIDQIVPTGGQWWGSNSFDSILVTLKSPYVGDLTSLDSTGHHNLNIVFGNAAGTLGGGEVTGTQNATRPVVPGSGTPAPALGANDQNISADIIAAIDQYNLDHPQGQINTGAGSLYANLTSTTPGSTWTVVERTITSNQLQLAGNTLGWSIPSGNSVQDYNQWMNSAVNGLIGSEITFMIDGVSYTRRIESLSLVQADGSPATSVYNAQNQISITFSGAAVSLKSFFVRNGANMVTSTPLPSQLVYGLTGLGKGTGSIAVAYTIQRGFGAAALKQGVLTSDTPNNNWGWFGTNLLPFYTYTETAGAGYAEFVDMGNGFSWDLTHANLSDVARTQLANSIKALLQSGQSISLAGLELYMTNQNGTLQGHDLGVYDNGTLHILTIVDADGNPLTASSPDSAWLTGRITFTGKVYAEKSQLEDLNVYQNTNVHDTATSGSYTPDLHGMTVNAGIRLVDNGFTQQSLTQFGAATLTLPGNDRLVQGQRVELSFANSTQTAIYYIQSVNGRVVTLSSSVDGAFNGGTPVSIAQIFGVAGSTPGAVTVKLLDAAASGATVSADNVITLTDMNIVPVTDANGQVTGYRALQNYDRVYLNDVRVQIGKTASLQTNVAYYVLVGANNTIQLFASKEQAVLHQQIELLNQTPEGRELVKALFTDAGITGELLRGFATADVNGMFTVSTHLFQTQAAGSTAGLTAQMQALHEQLKNQGFDPNYLPAALDITAAQNLVKSTRNQIVYDYVVDKELAQTAEYHNYWRDRLESAAGAVSSGLTAVG
ncbi:MAG: hypothetical protein ACN6PB_03260, partial [Achromobacter kerstersii]|uniref:hypothetical protein n=1 Tax=Achromobacter kerstersii TaxID=1353890 RepID=UPI003D07CB7F